MNRHFFIIESVTYAKKGRDLLVKAGYAASIEKISRPQKGCAYRLPTLGEQEKTAEILRKGGIPFLIEKGGSA